MNWNEYPLLRLLIPYLAGILLAYGDIIPLQLQLYHIIIPTIILLFIAIKGPSFFGIKYHFLNGIYLNFFFVFLGFLFTQNYFPYQKNNYFEKYIPQSSYFICKIDNQPLEKEKSIQLVVENLIGGNSDSSMNCSGKAIIYIKKDSLPNTFKYGDVLLIKNKYVRVSKCGNPFQFDYQKYLNNIGIQHQQYLTKDEIKIIKKNTEISLFSLTYQAQEFLLDILKKRIPGKDEQAVASALLIGVRSDISDELQNAYAGAGAIHVLSVSGLHVGIIYMILNQLLILIPAFKRKNPIKTIILLLSIWAFAFISGLSPSVLRASVMISFVILGSSLNRPTNIFNSLAVSAFFLLFFNPFLLFDVGFQLSYMAVIAIVSIQPFFYKLWIPNTIFTDKVWALITVSVAAQIGTLPFALYYFNQFPVLFIFSNFIVIPAAFVILCLGIVTMLFAWFDPIVNFLGAILGYLIYGMNQSILFIESLPFSVIHNITFDKLQFFLVAILIISLMTTIIQKKKWSVFLSFSTFILLLIGLIFQKNEEINHKELIFYQTNKNNILTIFEGKKATYLVDTSLEQNLSAASFQIGRHKIMSGVDDIKILGLVDNQAYYSRDFYRNHQFIYWGGKKFVLLSRDWKYTKTKSSFPCDYLIIYGNPYINMDNVIFTYRPKKVVIASSNSMKNTKKWISFLNEKGIQFYKISDQGAFRICLN